MRINPIASNMVEMEVDDTLILFSYRTPVACHIMGEGYSVTDTHHSPTTSRHIAKWLQRCGFQRDRGDVTTERPQEWFDHLGENIVRV